MQSNFQVSTTTWLRTGLLCVAAAITSHFLTSCGLEKPKAPNWTVDLLVPIANRHIDGPYVAAHAGSDYLTWNNDSGLVWKISAGLDTVLLGNNVTTVPPTASGVFPLGSIRVGENSELTCRVELAEVTPLTAGVVPELTTSMSVPLQSGEQFDTVQGASGILHLNVENELGVSVDEVTVTFFANGLTPLATINVPGVIASGSSRIVTQVISNLTFGDDWTTTLAFHTPGGTVLSAAEKFIAVQATFPEGLTATYARAIVGTSIRDHADSMVLSESHQLSAATIATGQLSMSWTNSTPIPATIRWESQDLLLGGLPLSGEATVPANGSHGIVVDLAGVNYSSAGEPSSARVAVSVQSAGSNGQTVEINSNQSIGYTLSWSEVAFAAATGHIAQTQFSTGTHTTQLQWENGLENAGLDQWSAYLIVASSLPLDAEVTGEVTTNTGLHLPVSGVVIANGVTPTRLELLHDDTPLSPLPSELQFTGTVRINSGGGVVSIDASDFVRASVEFSALAHMYVDSVELSIEPSSVALSGDDFGDRTDRLVNAIVTITVANRFPMGGEFTLRIASDSAGVNSPDAIAFGPSTLSPAVTDASGNAVSVSTTELTYTLDSTDLALFEREVIWFAESLTLLGPGLGQPARISPTDVLDWNAHARIEYRIDSDVRPWEN